jgi:hypothetical protein
VRIECQATGPRGECARGGMTRGAHHTCDHDVGGREQESPCGGVDADSGALPIPCDRSSKTSAVLVETLDAKWPAMDALAQAAGEWLQSNMAHGPDSRGVRPQCLPRRGPCADHLGTPIPLLSYPPSRSKYHPIARCWGRWEVPGNGTKVVAVETMMEWAKRMPWKRLHPVVTWRRKVDQQGIALGKKARQEVAHRLARHPALPK